MPRRNNNRTVALVQPAREQVIVRVSENTTRRGRSRAPPRRRARGQRGKRARGKARALASRYPGLTAAGEGFLKCAFAPPDFAFDGGMGVPDVYDGRVIIRRQNQIVNLTSSTTLDIYIVQMPTPGVVCWIGTLPMGTTISTTNQLVLSPYTIHDFAALFPSNQETTILPAFRYVSNAMELTSLMNEMTWSGMLTAFKPDITLNTQASNAAGQFLDNVLGGISNWSNNMVQGSGDCFIGTTKAGCYMLATNGQPDWEFTPIVGNAQTSMAVGGPTFPQEFILTNNFVGLGRLQSNVIIVPATTTVQQFVLRTWACIEYKVTIGSTLWEYSRTSAPFDPVALQLYRKMAHVIPIAVPCSGNASFWENLLRSLQSGAAAVANYLPGPIGMVASGISGIAKGVLAQFYD
jgi:hypothetical protein